MTLKVRSFVINESPLVWKLHSIDKTVTYSVENMPNAEPAILEALAAQNYVPAFGTAIADNGPLIYCRVVEKSATFIGGSGDDGSGNVIEPTVRVEVKYSTEINANPINMAQPAFSGGSVIREVQTSINGDGTPILITYKDASGNSLPAIGGTAQVSLPNSTFSVSREAGVNPFAIEATFAGKVNSTTFRGYGAGWWLCTGVTYNSPDDGSTYYMKYDFQRAADNILWVDSGGNITYKTVPWNPVDNYKNPDGTIPSNLNSSNGVIEVTWFNDKQADFTTLGFGV